MNFDKMLEITKNYVDQHMQELKDECNKDPDIAEFVRLITYPMLHNEEEHPDESLDHRTGQELRMFLWKISKVDLEITNPYHFNTNWIYELNSFIGNFFYDDAYFRIYKKVSFMNLWEVEADNDFGIQNVRALIEAARDNARFYAIEDQFHRKEITREEWMEKRQLGMQSSGLVEQAIEDYYNADN